MKFDSFISSPTTVQAAFRRWALWSVALTIITITSVVTIHLRTKQAHAACAKTCAVCEKIAASATSHQQKDSSSLSEKYTTINAQASAVRTHLNNKTQLATLAHNLVKTTIAPVTLQSMNLTARECTIIFRCPPTYAVEKLTQKLAADHLGVTFFVTRLEQREDALLATVTAQLA